MAVVSVIAVPRIALAVVELKAFECFHAAHAGMVQGYLRQRGLQHSDAEDLTQKVFLKAAPHFAMGEKEKLTRSWLIQVAKNEAIDFFRREATRKKHLPVVSDADRAPARTDMNEVESIHAGQLSGCLGKLSSSERSVVSSWTGGMKPREIADKMGREASVIHSTLHRAIGKLKVCMGVSEREKANPKGGRA